MDLISIYDKLFEKYGNQNWWPVHSDLNSQDQKFEIIVGAVLTQNTSWKNVEKAINKLYENKLLNVEKFLEFYKTDKEKLKEMIRSAGFFNSKVEYLYSASQFYLNFLKSEKKSPTREELLELLGVGEETADSILLYVFNCPYFIIDSYTKRLFSCLLKKEGKDFMGHNYLEWQGFFHSNLEKNAELFKEFHALIVQFGKDICFKNKKNCGDCFLWLW